MKRLKNKSKNKNKALLAKIRNRKILLTFKFKEDKIKMINVSKRL